MPRTAYLTISRLFVVPTVLMSLFAPAAALAQSAWTALKQPGAIAIMRHALAPGTGDPEIFQLGDCSTQRNLNEAGREQARAIGRAVRDDGMRPGRDDVASEPNLPLISAERRRHCLY